MGYRELSFGYRNCTSEEPDSARAELFAIGPFLACFPIWGDKKSEPPIYYSNSASQSFVTLQFQHYRKLHRLSKTFLFSFSAGLLASNCHQNTWLKAGVNSFILFFRDLLLTAFETNLAKNVQAQYISPKFAQVFF